MRLFLMAGPRVVSTGTRGGSACPHQCSAYAREVGNSNARLFDAYRCRLVITRKVRILSIMCGAWANFCRHPC